MEGRCSAQSRSSIYDRSIVSIKLAVNASKIERFQNSLLGNAN